MGPWQRKNAINVVRATARMAVLAKARQHGHAVDDSTPLLDGQTDDHPSVVIGAQDDDCPGQQQMPWGIAYSPTGIVSRRSLRTSTSLPGGSAASRQGSERARPKWYISDYYAVRQLILGSWINILLLFVPLGFAAEFLQFGPVWIFSLNFMSLIPLALVLGDITEDLAVRFGDVAGGLINASFGNVTEIILSLAALNKGLYNVVATSLIGSILSNLLLVLGCCFFFGGLRYKLQTFNQIGNRACSSLLFLSALGVVIPTAAQHLISTTPADPQNPDDWILKISRGTAIILFFVYACYLYFQLNTHHELFQAAEGSEGQDVDKEEPLMTLITSMILLVTITILVACSSEFLTGSLEEVVDQTGIGEAFLGMIVLPIAGNACEHITAILVARHNKMDLAMGVAVGSSIQIATFAIPVAVLYAWATGHMFSLSLDAFSALALMLSVVHANFIGSDATSHWLMGVQLIAVYLLIALTYLYRPAAAKE